MVKLSWNKFYPLLIKLLEMLQIMWRNRANLWKPPKKWRMEGESTFLFKGKIFFHSSILFFSYHSCGWIILYLLLYMIFVKKFCCSLKMQKWWSTSPIAKGMTAPTNNQQCKALNINFKPRTPTTTAKSSSSTSSQHMCPLLLSYIVAGLVPSIWGLLWVIDSFWDKYGWRCVQPFGAKYFLRHR